MSCKFAFPKCWFLQRERDHFEDLDVDEDNTEIDLKWDEGEWTGFVWLTIRAGGWLL